MTFSIGVVGLGQFGGHFAHLFKLHPGVSEVYAVDERPERAAAGREQWGLDGTKGSFEELLASDVDAVAIFTQRWTHGPLVVQALRAGKHVYSAVPMAVSEEEIALIIEAVRETGLVYAMGETSYYAGWATPRTSANRASGSSAPRGASNSSPM
ncbi:putative dehydrogenase [Arthrobacter sp. UYCu723]